MHSGRPRIPRGGRVAALAVVAVVAVVVAFIAFDVTSSLAASSAFLASPAPSSSLLPSPSLAAEVDTVRVAADRLTPEEVLRLRLGSATWIPLGRAAPTGRDLGELLDRSVGVHIHRLGGFGAHSVASVRGSTAGQVKVCLDGVALGAAGEGAIDLALLPLAAFDHAEVYRGAEAFAFGGAPAAGVIQLVTPTGATTPWRAALGGGSFGSRELRLSGGGALGGWRLLAVGGHRTSDGDFRYLDRNGTLRGNTDDDRVVERENNEFEETSALGKLSGDLRALDLGGVRLDYTALHLTRDAGVPGPENVQTRETRNRYTRTRHHLSAASGAGAGFDVGLSAHQENARDRFDNPAGEVGLLATQADARTRDRGFGVALGWAGEFGAPVTATLRAERSEERRRSVDRLRADAAEEHERATRAWITAVRTQFGRLHLGPTYRWFRAADDFAVSSFGSTSGRSSHVTRFEHVTWGARFDLGRGFHLEGSRGRLLRAPNFAELFGLYGLQDGNDRLRPERGQQWDAGFAGASASAQRRFEAVYFERIVRDQISLLQNSQRTVKAQNLDRAWVRGVEMSAVVAFELPAQITLRSEMAATWQEALDVGRSRTYRGKRLPNLPEREAVATTELARSSLTAHWTVDGRSDAYRDRYNTEGKRTPPYRTHDLGLRVAVAPLRSSVSFEVRNVGDVRVQDLDGFPLPGRSYWMEVTWDGK